MAQKMKWSNFFKPTPKRIRVLGDSLAAGSVFVAGLAIVGGYEKIAVGVAISGWIGKFLSQFFAEDEKK